MKIVLCCATDFTTKMNYFEYALAKEIKKQGIDLEIITKDRHPDFVDYVNSMEKILGPRIVGVGSFDEDGFIVHRIKTYLFGKNKKLELNFGWLREIKKIKPDIIFFYTIEHPLNGIQVLFAKLLYNCKIYFYVNEHFNQNATGDSKIKSFKNIILDNLYLFLKKICVRYADRVIAMNEYCRDVAYKLAGKKNKDIVTVSLGVDTSEIYFKPDKRAIIRNKFNVKDEEILLIHSGKMHKAKKTELLLEYLKNTEFKNVKLMLVGSFILEYKDYLWKLIDEFKIQDKIIYIPFVKSDELHHYFSAADIAVWPDSATISTIEASAVGIPVVVADFYGYEHRTQNNSGLKVKRGDIIDLTNKLNLLIENTDLRIRMGKNARKMTEEHLNWEIIVNKILAN